MRHRLTNKPKALSLICAATSICSKCHADCAIGHFRNGCGGSANGHGIGQCEACTNKPPGNEVTGDYYYYTSQGGVNLNNCSYVLCPSCPIGFVRVGCAGTGVGECKRCSNAKVGEHYASPGHMGTGLCDVKACANAPKQAPGGGDQGYYYIGAAAGAQTECAYERCDALAACGVGKYRLGCGGASKVRGLCLWGWRYASTHNSCVCAIC